MWFLKLLLSCLLQRKALVPFAPVGEQVSCEERVPVLGFKKVLQPLKKEREFFPVTKFQEAAELLVRLSI